ncbi:phage infection protein [Curtobacterium sp. MCLR17_044]|uniref:phage infection protein n=1 Tax=Curtobacterium sp. MCLR17_044 TaxID=2175628 RepID=UPI000DA6E628|nr:phage infection protein [Curtobacterium sp. MCLR17_044]PZE55678.1 phage infection protein [Curtobacterium sp. MCLR17_044]
MRNLQLSLRNCHGIRELDATLPFERLRRNTPEPRRSIAIYAPNGTMKSSFARTFLDLARGEESSDHIFPDRDTVRKIHDDSGNEITPESVAVFLAYDEQYAPDKYATTLLVNASLRKEFESIQKGLSKIQGDLTKELKKTAQTKQDVAQLVSQVFTKEEDNFFEALTRVSYEVEELEEPVFAGVPYDTLFNSSVDKVLSDPDLSHLLADYVKRLNQLLDDSTFFSRESFNYYNAETVSKSLVSHGYFKAKHSLLLAGEYEPHEISSENELTTLIIEEKRRIHEDPDLAAGLERLGKALNANQATRDFFKFISGRPELLVEFENIDRFKEKLWVSYFKIHDELFGEAVRLHKSSRERRREILKTAAAERTQWEEVIEQFNDRFDVPFKLIPKNRVQVMLAQEPFLTVDFEFEDGGGSTQVDREHLLQVLSTGEKKALYILNILFEVEARRKSGELSLFIIDDIADSFDYKNKYAIIHYLKEMEAEAHFRLVILTHNFDFLRTIRGREVVSWGGCFVAEKSTDRVRFEAMNSQLIQNPFEGDLKGKMFTNARERIACIPFARNILEYSRGNQDSSYLRLTSLLHLKTDSRAITQADLDALFHTTFMGTEANAWSEGDETVIDAIWHEADECLDADEGVNFANKIVLAIALRLRAESYMLKLISDPNATDAITKNQTWALFKLVEEGGTAQPEELRVLRSVLLTTAETLHLNSFMYEPIIDMSDQSLRALYSKVTTLDRAAAS